MNDIDEYRRHDQNRIFHYFTIDTNNNSDIKSINLAGTNQNFNDSSLVSDLTSLFFSQTDKSSLISSTFTSIAYKIILGFICACLCLLTISGNFLVLITFRRIRTVGNLFILSLATADLIVGCFVMPIAGIYAIMEKWKMGLVLCQIWLSVDFTASTASIFNLLTLSLDRYWSITSPLQYLGKRTRTRALFMIGFAWGLSLLWVIPIVGWHKIVNNGTRFIDDYTCDPEYAHSKIFKVSTAIINFYLPLLVMISLNGRIYYEIKRRYKNVFLQRLSTTKTKDTTNLNNNNNHPNKITNRHSSRAPITMTLCDSDRQLCSTTINVTPENDSLIMSKMRTNNPNDDSILRINFKEKKHRPGISLPMVDSRKLIVNRTATFIDNKNHCTQDELTWFARRREQARSSSLSPARINSLYHKAEHSPSSLPLRHHRAGATHRLFVDERCFKHTHDYHSCRIYSNNPAMKQFDISRRKSSNLLPNHNHNHRYYQSRRRQKRSSHNLTSRGLLVCRRCSMSDSMTAAAASSTTTTTTTTMNIFNLCHFCSAATSAITIHANPFVSTPPSESYNQTRQMSSSSSSSIAPSSLMRRQVGQPLSSFTPRTNSTTSSISMNSHRRHHNISNKIKQTTIWNQQEKAFRQLFAIVFGFTCCFLPYFILYMVVAFCELCVSQRFVTASIWLGYVNSTINPFLYALSNKHFRRTFNRILKRDQRRQSYYN